MKIVWKPAAIENESMRIIDGLIDGHPFRGVEKDVVKRIVHTTGDPHIVGKVRFHESAGEEGVKALDRGADIFTDVNMLKAGINSKTLEGLGGKAHCTIAEPAVNQMAREWGITRAAAAIRLHGAKLNNSIVAVGNAPTALFELLDLIDKGTARPVLIVGTPVGFVGARESKELLEQQREIPYITISGTRGGSPIAAAIINALMYHRERRV